MEKETKQEFENLGRMIKIGFDAVDKRFEQGDKKIDDLDAATDERFLELQSEMKDGFKGVNEKIGHVEARISYIERDISEIRKHFVYRDEFEDLMGRVKYLEAKLGIESGK